MDNESIEFCKCENLAGVYSELCEWGYWLKCCECNKRIEDSFVYYSDEDISID